MESLPRTQEHLAVSVTVNLHFLWILISLWAEKDPETMARRDRLRLSTVWVPMFDRVSRPTPRPQGTIPKPQTQWTVLIFLIRKKIQSPLWFTDYDYKVTFSFHLTTKRAMGRKKRRRSQERGKGTRLMIACSAQVIARSNVASPKSDNHRLRTKWLTIAWENQT